MSRAAARKGEAAPLLASLPWPELVNLAPGQPGTATLIDGTQVDSTSEAWRAECEARHVLLMPTKLARLEYLGRVEKRRGAESRAALEAAVMGLWRAMRGAG